MYVTALPAHPTGVLKPPVPLYPPHPQHLSHLRRGGRGGSKQTKAKIHQRANNSPSPPRWHSVIPPLLPPTRQNKSLTNRRAANPFSRDPEAQRNILAYKILTLLSFILAFATSIVYTYYAPTDGYYTRGTIWVGHLLLYGCAMGTLLIASYRPSRTSTLPPSR